MPKMAKIGQFFASGRPFGKGDVKKKHITIHLVRQGCPGAILSAFGPLKVPFEQFPENVTRGTGEWRKGQG